MSLVTLDEYRIELDEPVGEETSELTLFSRMASLSQALADRCNRYFPMMVSRVAYSNVVDPDLDLTLTVPYHGMAVGDSVRIESTLGVISGTFTITAVDLHTFTVSAELTETEASELLDSGRQVSVRKVHTVVKSTRGGDSVFVYPRPVADVVSVTLDTVTVPATDYALADRTDGVSISGQIRLKTNTWPTKAETHFYSDGATIAFVPGEKWPIPALRAALLDLLKNFEDRVETAGFQSESYDYYSYSKQSPDQVGMLFGESDYMIRQFTLPGV